MVEARRFHGRRAGWTRLRRLPAAAGMWLTLAGAGDPAHTSATVGTDAQQTLRGWGMSLGWEANVIYGGPFDTAHVQDLAEQGRYMDLLFGDPARGPGLGLNVARYNIGGGDNPEPGRCPRPAPPAAQPGARMEGFLAGPGAAYDWSRDAGQRRMLHEAQARGATVFEAFSNSAPWWMTASGCASGAERAGEDNLRADAVPAFAAYLAAVAEHFRREEGIAFGSVSPLNEPDGAWWVSGGRQEGSFASLPMQEAVIAALARALAGGAVVSGTDANSMDAMTGYLVGIGAASLDALGQVNVHQYNGTDPAALRRRVAALGKPLWASEVGCCFSAGQTEMQGALYMASAIRTALRDLGAEVWCFWQPDWGVIDARDGHPRPLRQFYAIAQYTRFIRPGFTVLPSQGDTLAALSPDGRRLVLVSTNGGGEEAVADIDLTRFHRPGAAVAVYRTTEDPAVSLAHAAGRVDDAGHLIDRQPPASVTTYVIEGEPVAARRGR